jgi:hypothetical protein
VIEKQKIMFIKQNVQYHNNEDDIGSDDHHYGNDDDYEKQKHRDKSITYEHFKCCITSAVTDTTIK